MELWYAHRLSILEKGEGKEVVQLYLSKQEEKNHLEHPYQELKGFENFSS